MNGVNAPHDPKDSRRKRMSRKSRKKRKSEHAPSITATDAHDDADDTTTHNANDNGVDDDVIPETHLSVPNDTPTVTRHNAQSAARMHELVLRAARHGSSAAPGTDVERTSPAGETKTEEAAEVTEKERKKAEKRERKEVRRREKEEKRERKRRKRERKEAELSAVVEMPQPPPVIQRILQESTPSEPVLQEPSPPPSVLQSFVAQDETSKTEKKRRKDKSTRKSKKAKEVVEKVVEDAREEPESDVEAQVQEKTSNEVEGEVEEHKALRSVRRSPEVVIPRSSRIKKFRHDMEEYDGETQTDANDEQEEQDNNAGVEPLSLQAPSNWLNGQHSSKRKDTGKRKYESMRESTASSRATPATQSSLDNWVERSQKGKRKRVETDDDVRDAKTPKQATTRSSAKSGVYSSQIRQLNGFAEEDSAGEGPSNRPNVSANSRRKKGGTGPKSSRKAPNPNDDIADYDEDADPRSLPVSGKYSQAEKDRINLVIDRFGMVNQLTRPQVYDIIHEDSRTNEGTRELFADLKSALPNRDQNSIQKFCRRTFHNYSQNASNWTPEEDIQLQQLHTRFGSKWKDIAAIMDRPPDACQDRWKNYATYGQNLKTGPWDSKEERRFMEICLTALRTCKRNRDERFGTNSTLEDCEPLLPWVDVARELGGSRGRLQCSRKWKLMKKYREVKGIKLEDIDLNSLPNSHVFTNQTPSKNSSRRAFAERNVALMAPGDLYEVLDQVAASGAVDATRINWTVVNQRNPDSRWEVSDRQVAWEQMLASVPEDVAAEGFDAAVAHLRQSMEDTHGKRLNEFYAGTPKLRKKVVLKLRANGETVPTKSRKNAQKKDATMQYKSNEYIDEDEVGEDEDEQHEEIDDDEDDEEEDDDQYEDQVEDQGEEHDEGEEEEDGQDEEVEEDDEREQADDEEQEVEVKEEEVDSAAEDEQEAEEYVSAVEDDREVEEDEVEDEVEDKVQDESEQEEEDREVDESEQEQQVSDEVESEQEQQDYDEDESEQEHQDDDLGESEQEDEDEDMEYEESDD